MQSVERHYTVALGLLWLLACQDPAGVSPTPAPEPPPASLDAGFPPDAAPPVPDAEPPADARPVEPPPDAGFRDDAAPLDSGLSPDSGQLTISQRCFSQISSGQAVGPNYDQFSPVVGSHCKGTNHQNITGIEKVVYLGDSITVGTPPTLPSEFYRNRLTAALRQKFGSQLEASSCAAWGAQTDDLLMPSHMQIQTCFPTLPENKRTLVVMTVGGNDLGHVEKIGGDGAPLAETSAYVEQSIANMRAAVHWFKDDPTRFPNGVFVIYGNLYEFTDATGDVTSCPAATLAGFSHPWPDAEPLVIHIEEQYMQIAVETQTDMLFMLESFCGHGYHHNDPNSRCYRGPGTPIWFDLTCIHPNPTGHQELADMFMAVVNE